jgi:hypothetical protein
MTNVEVPLQSREKKAVKKRLRKSEMLAATCVMLRRSYITRAVMTTIHIARNVRK